MDKKKSDPDSAVERTLDRPKPKWRKRLRLAGWLTLILFILVGLAYLFRAPLLTSVAESWIVHEPDFDWVDAVVVPGGGLETRPFQAAKLFHEGKTDTILVFETESSPSTEIGVSPPHIELVLETLKRLDVPSEAISPLGKEIGSTMEEVDEVVAWAEEVNAKSIAVMSEIFPSRRVNWAFERKLLEMGVVVHVIAIHPRKYSASNWWQEETGVISFQNEVVKFLYYLLKY